MEAITTVTGRAVPLPRSNIDTDQILPGAYLKRVTRTGFADVLFEQWRTEPDFVLNDPANHGAPILVAGEDFGIGSSREHAVWALRDFGFRVVISSRFADIFRNNAGNNGLLTAEVTEEVAEQLFALLATQPDCAVSVDLTSLTITAGNATYPFTIDEYTRYRLLNGLDDIGITLEAADAIAAYAAQRPPWMPVTTTGQ
ncbi:3-isopropylmalate dehydratase small subunit [Corynebacterium choanae]|uniref:3-isopropylmalate dehydratase small subunit n=1 Tax=Corynebacterium choanae TaxID=1862358 RepID=A0A3G6JBC3_9CORY|nr:3-isopropylmalate dehydratase small subunit [Corynebacterium choanae]AZA13404.1 3-isopropylmalate dehydratase small subunit [Corynebacterium choanae]